MTEEHREAESPSSFPGLDMVKGQHCTIAEMRINTTLTPRGCLMLYVSIPLDTFSMNSPLRSTARLHAYSTTSAVHGHTSLATSGMKIQH